MKIRIADTNDVEDLVPLFEQLGYACSAGEISTRIVLQCASDRDITLVAEIDARVRGVIAMHIHAPIHVPGKWYVRI